MTQSKVLLIGGDGSTDHTLAMLSHDGYRIIATQDHAGVTEIVKRENPDIIILDIVLPEDSGYSTCRALRQFTDAPIFLLVDNADIEDLIKSFDLGADGYMARPFSDRELAARIKALLRRVRMQYLANQPTDETLVLRANDLVIDMSSYRVIFNGTPMKLSRIEFNLLSFLIRARGVVFSREQLLEKLWGQDFEGDTRTIDTHIWSLRQKIESDPAHPRHLVAVRGSGYKFE
jgi:two-component system OmpR family response regulator